MCRSSHAGPSHQAGSGRRRRQTLPVVAVLIAAASSLPAAQKAYPVFTQDDFVKFMKTVGQNFGAVNASVEMRDFESAKSQLTRSREQLAVTVTFWRDRKKDDALKFLKDTLVKMDDLDDELSKETIDPNSVSGIVRQVNASCEACHAAYREYNPATKTYRFKSGSIP